MRVPWDNSGTADNDPASWPWELYDLSKDWTQYNDVADQCPEKVKELEALFWKEAERNQVLPLDTTTFTRSLLPRPNLTAGRSMFTYSGKVTGTPNGNAPNVLASSYNIKAEVVIPEGGAEGMLVTHGGRFAGYDFYLLDGKPVYTWNLLGMKHVKWQGPDALTPGAHTLEFDFKYDGLGADSGSPVADEDYQTPFEFTGKLDKLTLTIDRPKLSPEDIEKLKMAVNGNPASE